VKEESRLFAARDPLREVSSDCLVQLEEGLRRFGGALSFLDEMEEQNASFIRSLVFFQDSPCGLTPA
jgi:hypothetical protein